MEVRKRAYAEAVKGSLNENNGWGELEKMALLSGNRISSFPVYRLIFILPISRIHIYCYGFFFRIVVLVNDAVRRFSGIWIHYDVLSYELFYYVMISIYTVFCYGYFKTLTNPISVFHYQESCPCIKNILLLDSEGKRVAVKYYTDDWPTLASKLAFEKSVFTKTQKTNSRTEGNMRSISFFYFHNSFYDYLQMHCTTSS